MYLIVRFLSYVNGLPTQNVDFKKKILRNATKQKKKYQHVLLCF